MSIVCPRASSHRVTIETDSSPRTAKNKPVQCARESIVGMVPVGFRLCSYFLDRRSCIAAGGSMLA